MEANLWHHPNGTWYALWASGRGSRRKSLKTKDKKEALRRMNNYIRDVNMGKIIPIAAEAKKLRMTLKPFIIEFLEHKETEVESSTFGLYGVALAKALDIWGDIPLMSITTRHLDLYKTELVKSGLKKVTVNKNYRHLKAALKKAIAWDYIVKVNFPRMFSIPTEARYMTKPELRALMAAMPDQEFADLCMFAAYTGLRSSEILRLQHEDINSPPGFIRISSKQKNHTESRIPLTAQALAIIERYPGTGQIFRFNTTTWISQKFRIARDKAGLKNFRFHDLRHTYASHLSMDNESLKTVQELMRHKSITSTLVYAHLSPAHLSQAANRLNYGPMPIPQSSTGKNQIQE